ncbi:MAG: hypothetical protein FWG55_07370 [Candidatus Bathyarchaeota archaeon]|nr:hypothetical protein [Candidatus Termiticorpusculum sp.]
MTTFIGVNVEPVNAAKTAREWGHLNPNLYSVNPTRYNNELSWETTICNNVNSMLAGKGWSSINSYGTSTYPAGVYGALDATLNPSSYIPYATNFWVGDYFPSMSANPTPYGYLGCYTSVTGSYVWDYEVYNHATAYGTQASKNYFTFIWTCANGGIYWFSSSGGYYVIDGITFPVIQSTKPTITPPVNTNTYYGYRVDSTHIVGMPYAWTGTTGMSLNGYNNPSGDYTYIDWGCNSPFMIDQPPAGSSSINLQYLYFVYNFYNYALGYVTGSLETINNSLDYAAKATFGKQSGGADYTFGTSVLNVGQWMNEPNFPSSVNYWFYCRMRVFGNGAKTIQ